MTTEPGSPGPDPVFSARRLAEIYDDLDPDRSDLDVYAALVEELGAHAVLDVGCGTGTFACLLAAKGLTVVGVDPALASLDVARVKPGAERVRWLAGDATTLPELSVDVALMTANVAQVFLSDEVWLATLRGVWAALRPGGHLIFETRNPKRRAWESWNRDDSYAEFDTASAGRVGRWADLIQVDGQLVTFRATVRFERSGDVMTSDSTLRFRERPEIEADLQAAGFSLLDVRDAPDRPGMEFVFIAERPG